MVRPRKRRRLSRSTRQTIYKPAGVPLEGLRQIVLQPDELEALRLADIEGFSQADSARQMGISRSTFQRTVSHARRQVALALVEGQALYLQGVAKGTAPGGMNQVDYETMLEPDAR